ncbi:MAG: hypothetical protein L6R40_000026 [Gallowayella cf. fulva]|nr:MAG: hypothetical protein L6R40_000026 [Xanthomendoza cf. fulva]
MDFLEEHGFDREAARKTGIHYLSRAEEARERSLNAQAQDKTRFVDVQPKADDKKAWELLERLRREVNAWVNQVAPKPDFLNFAPIGHNKAPFPDKGLNNFQKLLVHQCIRKEYPDLVTFSQPGFIQIVAYDKEREDARVEYRAGKFEERLVRQVGLRWLIEAIHGGDISKINPDGINRGAGVGKISGVSMFTSIQEQLLGASTVLVGHNLFMDLIYFYACFFGPLPDKVEDFQSIIHKVFPRIIDTKYLATHDDPYLETSELGQLDQKLASEAGPEIAHSKYASAKPSHEAGYDSYMTARVFLRLSTKLEASGKYLEEPPSPVDDVFYTPPEMGVLIDYNDIPGQLQAIDESSSGSTSRPSSGSAVSRPMFSHATKFDLLGDLSAEVDTITLEGRKQPPGRLPAWESDFWKVYGNKLRVNGTIEEVSDVGEWPQ